MQTRLNTCTFRRHTHTHTCTHFEIRFTSVIAHLVSRPPAVIMMVDDLCSKQWLDLENTMLAAVTETIQAKIFELVHLVPDAEGIEKITVAAIEQHFQVALSFCRATLFGALGCACWRTAHGGIKQREEAHVLHV